MVGGKLALFHRVENIRIDRLVIGAQQARTRDVEQDISELVDSIRAHGQLEPIIITPAEDRAGFFEILAGQRRWIAMRRLGAAEISAAIIEDPPDRDMASALSISENLIRRNLNTLDLIDACTKLYNKYGSIKAVAEKFGLPYGRVRRYVKFDRLRSTLKEFVKKGDIDLGTALRIEDHCGTASVDDAHLRRLAAAMAGMSNAQQSDYLKSNTVDGEAAENAHRPGSVKQIIVTLSISDVQLLRAWAGSKNLTQDRAGARIISAFLRQAMIVPDISPGTAGGGSRRASPPAESA
ncbi:MAG TPA: ParB/RepB/Spo0J family partition protein [Streptosporangiaceae bacterium]